MEAVTPGTVKRLLIVAAWVVIALILLAAGVYAIAFIMLAPMMT